ncbi:MAG TPA: VWA domain-containing protein [Sandaracinaceae bacterium LLY-WYZ-13_1]|nr:VWA domain-containing protein [Sandaracinaceae bacterium LLY-WYZ-13_1]
MTRRGRLAWALAAALALGGCGSKSPLRVPDPGPDAGVRDGGPRDAGTDAGPTPDECVALPFREPPREVGVEFVTQIRTADVLFLVDVTGSMGEEISAIRRQLRERIVPGLAAEIPDARFSVAHFADFPLPEHNYGEEGDQLYRLATPSTPDVAAVQRAVDELPLQGGRDGPEAMVEALFLSATGQGLGAFAPAARCPAGTVGYPCFRREGARIVLAFSDAPSHNGPGGSEPYREGTVRPRPHTYEEAVNALRGIGAKVLGLYSGGSGGLGRRDLVALARDTGAVRGDGTPVVLDIGREAEELGPSVVEAVRSLVDEVPIDVDLRVEDVEGDAVDVTDFVEAVVAVRAEPPDGATRLEDRFTGVVPGTRLRFAVRLFNERIPQTDERQSFLMRLVVRGDRVTRLSETLVQIDVPPIGGGVVCPGF